MNHITHSTCNKCYNKLRSIGLSEKCAICHIRNTCHSAIYNYECPNLIEGNSKYCKSCNIVVLLRHELKETKELLTIYQKEEIERLNMEDDKIVNELKKSMA